MSFKLRSRGARESVKRHSLIRFLAGAAVVVIAAFVVYTMVSNNIRIQEDKKRYGELLRQTQAVSEENERINGYLEKDENLKQYIEEIAREKLDFANPDERIYYIIPGSNE